MSRDRTSTPALTVRQAEPSDRGAIRALLAELGYSLDASTLEERIDRVEANPLINLFVAVRDETVVGLGSLHVLHLIERPPLGRLSAIVVAEAERRSGVGLALIERLEESARALGCDRLEVTSGERREDAHAFYGALGFEETSKRFIKGL